MPGLALTVWVLVFAAALVGLAVGARLPDRHRTDDSRSVVSVSMAMVGTLTALVLGLLLSSASSSFGAQKQLLMLISTDLMRTDRALRAYGPEANDVRAALRQYAVATLHDIFPPNGGQPQTENEVTLKLLAEAERKLANLSPQPAEPGMGWRHRLRADRTGFLYLVAIMDWARRAVQAWRLSNTMDVSFCVSALREALARFGKPEIFNTDRGSQFTSEAFIGCWLPPGCASRWMGAGRWMDNVFIERLWCSSKYEDIYPNMLPNGILRVTNKS